MDLEEKFRLEIIFLIFVTVFELYVLFFEFGNVFVFSDRLMVC